MHELGIIIHISKTLKEVAEENEVTKIGSVTLEIGEAVSYTHLTLPTKLEV